MDKLKIFQSIQEQVFLANVMPIFFVKVSSMVTSV